VAGLISGIVVRYATAMFVKVQTFVLALVPIVIALVVVTDYFDDPALAHAAVAAFVDHAPQLGLERTELLNPTVDFLEVPLGDAVGFVAGFLGLLGERQKLADILDLEAELACVPDEVEPQHLRGTVTALLPRGPGRRGKQADLLIIPDGRHLDLSPLRQIADREIHRIIPLKL
jgi:hypothetical protein